jgi:hypothetical protein
MRGLAKEEERADEPKPDYVHALVVERGEAPRKPGRGGAAGGRGSPYVRDPLLRLDPGEYIGRWRGDKGRAPAEADEGVDGVRVRSSRGGSGRKEEPHT